MQIINLIAPYAWLGMLAAAALLCFAIEDSTFLLSVGTIAFVLLGAITFHLTSFAAILAHPVLIPIFVIGYVVVGSVWVWGAWASYLGIIRDRADEYGEIFDAMPSEARCKNKQVQPDPEIMVPGPRLKARLDEPTWIALEGDELLKARRDHIRLQIGMELPPKVRQHKAKIICWMAYWPFSMIRTLLNDPFRRLWNAIYRAYAGRLQAMSDKAFAKH